MVVLVRFVLDDGMMRAFKERIGTKATRKAVKAEAERLMRNALYPDGAPKPKKQKFKLTR